MATVFNFMNVSFDPCNVSGYTRSIINRTDMLTSMGVDVTLLCVPHSSRVLDSQHVFEMGGGNKTGKRLLRTMAFDLVGNYGLDVGERGVEGQAPPASSEDYVESETRATGFEHLSLVVKALSSTRLEVRDSLVGDLVSRASLRADGSLEWLDLFANSVRTHRIWYSRSNIRVYSNHVNGNGNRVVEQRYYDAHGTVRLLHILDGDVWVYSPTDRIEYIGNTEGLIRIWLNRLELDSESVFLSEWHPFFGSTRAFTKDHSLRHVETVHSAFFSDSKFRMGKISDSWKTILSDFDDVDSLVLISDEMRVDFFKLIGRTADHVVSIPHYVPSVATDDDMERSSKKAVMVARLDNEAKNFVSALRAFRLVLQNCPEAKLEIWGEGRDRALIESTIEELGLAGSVALKGVTNDPGAVYRTAALSVFTSSFEGYPLSLAEALQGGAVPVCYRFKFGASDQVRNGYNGLVVDMGNEEELAASICLLLNDSEYCQQLRRNAIAGTTTISYEDYRAKWLAVLGMADLCK